MDVGHVVSARPHVLGGEGAVFLEPGKTAASAAPDQRDHVGAAAGVVHPGQMAGDLEKLPLFHPRVENDLHASNVIAFLDLDLRRLSFQCSPKAPRPASPHAELVLARLEVRDAEDATIIRRHPAANVTVATRRGRGREARVANGLAEFVDHAAVDGGRTAHLEINLGAVFRLRAVKHDAAALVAAGHPRVIAVSLDAEGDQRRGQAGEPIAALLVGLGNGNDAGGEAVCVAGVAGDDANAGQGDRAPPAVRNHAATDRGFSSENARSGENQNRQQGLARRTWHRSQGRGSGRPRHHGVTGLPGSSELIIRLPGSGGFDQDRGPLDLSENAEQPLGS